MGSVAYQSLMTVWQGCSLRAKLDQLHLPLTSPLHSAPKSVRDASSTGLRSRPWAQLNLTPENNSTPSHAVIQKHVQDFYNVAGEGVSLWLLLLPKSGTSAAFTKVFEANGPADKMTERSGGRAAPTWRSAPYSNDYCRRGPQVRPP